MSDHEMPKTYDPLVVEDGIYKAWEASGFFNPDHLSGERKTPYTISLPPPNTTGTLHLGHAMYTVQDVLIRFERMRGKATLWLPGTDHAAIATNAKVERLLKEQEGVTRHELGREAFIERVNAFIKDSQGTINHQLRKMGFSLDWSREAYTLDEPRNRAVREIFKRMYDAGLIYRGDRVINWDPQAQSTISDDEIVYVEREATLYTFRYAKDLPIAISTTRPETKVGDTAIAVHPSDERYMDLVGKTFDVSFAGTTLHLRVIADHHVDPEFGTGALGVTPSHSTMDYDLAQRHDLPMKSVIDKDARMTETAGFLVAGQTTLEARETVVAWLRAEGLLEKEETIIQNISTSERTGAVVEPLPMKQWFIDVNKPFAFQPSKRHPIEGFTEGQEVTLKELMQSVVASGQIKVIPERFEKTYFNWVENLRDWNISRQIWFGHQVPVWYRSSVIPSNDEGSSQVEMVVGEAPEGEGWEQDPDVLDTWFSSGIWTFSTLGWPEETSDLHRFHPTDVLETGYDILSFWVARMILMTTFALGEVPFKTVYLHGLVRDEQGRKMSKSLENIINPLDVAEKYGTDAVRLALIIGSTPGQDKNLSEQKIEAYRNFSNKLWNISRFIFGSVEKVEIIERAEAKTLADEWILKRLEETILVVTGQLETFQLSSSAEELRDFTWNDFADWYLEIAKIEGNKDRILLYVLERLLVLWHPFIPFVTEEIWKQFRTGDFLMVHDWPVVGGQGHRGAGIGVEMRHLQNVIVAIRNLRSENNVPAGKKVTVTLVSEEQAPLLEEQKALIHGLARVESLTISSKQIHLEGNASTVVPSTSLRAGGTTEVYLSLEGLVDVEAERSRLAKELKEAQAYETSIKAKLDNNAFISKAPAPVVEGIKATYVQTQERVQKLEEQLARLA